MSTTTDKATKDLREVLDTTAGWPQPFATIGVRLNDTYFGAGPRLEPRLW